MRLSEATLSQVPEEVGRFRYDRDQQAIGIVHFGIGAFHRAHQAWYTDLAMDAGCANWAICGVSLRSTIVGDQLNPQDGLYTVTERSGVTSQSRVVGAVREVLFAPESQDAVIERIAAPDCQIVSFTVTEKGYARGKGGQIDLAAAENSFYPYLAEALSRRMQRGLPGISLLPCDNLPNNGRVLRNLMQQWLDTRMGEVADWFARECTVPSTMIDRIVPRSAAADLSALENRLGLRDDGAVFTEHFSQWVIEDDFAGRRPLWDNHGAQIVEDVEPYETAKLRLLNGAHSLLAYCGLRKGYEFVHQAVADPELRALAVQLMCEEAAPTIVAAADQDLGLYADQLIDRFADPALRHKLAQIAMDGSQKIPQRWLDTALWHAKRDALTPAILEGFDAWIWHLQDGRFVDDPAAENLHDALTNGGKELLLSRCLNAAQAAKPIWQGYQPLFELWSPLIKAGKISPAMPANS